MEVETHLLGQVFLKQSADESKENMAKKAKISKEKCSNEI